MTRIFGESEHGFGWIEGVPEWQERAACALAADGGVWLVEPTGFPGLEERVRALGEPRAVLQLVDRHPRENAAVAERLGVPLLVLPTELPGTPFELVHVPTMPKWVEYALWWPETRTLVVPEALGTAAQFCAPGRPLGVHPILRLWRPPRSLLRFEPEHLFVGHGASLHEDVPALLQHAIRHARRELPRALPRAYRISRGR